MLSHSVPSPRSQMKADCRLLVPTQANHDPASPPAAPPQSRLYKLIAGRFVPFAAPTILGLLMVIFLVIPARMQPELRLIPGSSLSSLNISISISHCELVTIEYARMKLPLSSDGRLTLSRPSLESTFAQAHGWVTSLGAKALTTLLIVADLGVNGREVKIDVAAKAKRSLFLGPWWVAVLDVNISFTGLTFTAPSDGEGSGNQMILQGILSCSIDIIPQLWQEKPGVLV